MDTIDERDLHDAFGPGDEHLLHTLRNGLGDDTHPVPDGLIAGAHRSGRRRVAGRRIVAATGATALVAAGAMAAGQLAPRQTVAAAAGPSSTSSLAPKSPAPSNNPAASSSGTSGTMDVTVRSTEAEETIIRDHLKAFDVAVTGHSINWVTMKASDAKGTSWAAAGMARSTWPQYAKAEPCTAAMLCQETKVGTATLRVYTDNGEKAGHAQAFQLYRADGYVIVFDQIGAFSGNGPQTRPGRLLTQAEAVALLTDSRWDAQLRYLPTDEPLIGGTRTIAPTPGR